MRQLFFLISTLFLFFTASSGTAVLIGRAQPLPEHLAIWHLTDCAPPCWIGIVPGKTTSKEAIKRIETVFSETENYRLLRLKNVDYIGYFLDTKRGPINRIEIGCSVDNEIVYSCLVLWRPILPFAMDVPTIGQIQMLWGPPSKISVDDSWSMPEFYASNGSLQYRVDGGKPLMPHTQILFLYFILPKEVADQRTISFRPWQGFASIKVYERMPPYYP